MNIIMRYDNWKVRHNKMQDSPVVNLIFATYRTHKR